MTHLTRCPSCKKTDIILSVESETLQEYYYACLDCGLQSAHTGTVQGAKVLWNKFARLNMTPEEKREEKNALGKQYYNENKERIAQQRKEQYDSLTEKEKAECKRVQKIKYRVAALIKHA